MRYKGKKGKGAENRETFPRVATRVVLRRWVEGYEGKGFWRRTLVEGHARASAPTAALADAIGWEVARGPHGPLKIARAGVRELGSRGGVLQTVEDRGYKWLPASFEPPPSSILHCFGSCTVLCQLIECYSRGVCSRAKRSDMGSARHLGRSARLAQNGLWLSSRGRLGELRSLGRLLLYLSL